MTTALAGTSFCQENECPSCLSRNRCILMSLTSECNIIAKFLGKSSSELFPSLEVLQFLLLKEDR